MDSKQGYDLKVLGEMIKGKGLDLAEDSLVLVTKEIFQWLEDSAKISPNPYDDMALIVLPQIKIKALAALDKIDGQVG